MLGEPACSPQQVATPAARHHEQIMQGNDGGLCVSGSKGLLQGTLCQGDWMQLNSLSHLLQGSIAAMRLRGGQAAMQPLLMHLWCVVF